MGEIDSRLGAGETALNIWCRLTEAMALHARNSSTTVSCLSITRPRCAISTTRMRCGLSTRRWKRSSARGRRQARRRLRPHAAHPGHDAQRKPNKSATSCAALQHYTGPRRGSALHDLMNDEAENCSSTASRSYRPDGRSIPVKAGRWRSAEEVAPLAEKNVRHRAALPRRVSQTMAITWDPTPLTIGSRTMQRDEALVLR